MHMVPNNNPKRSTHLMEADIGPNGKIIYPTGPDEKPLEELKANYERNDKDPIAHEREMILMAMALPLREDNKFLDYTGKLHNQMKMNLSTKDYIDELNNLIALGENATIDEREELLYKEAERVFEMQ